MAERFKPQLKAPDLDDPWFIRKDAGGYSPCIPGKPLRAKGNTLANCVGWAWGISAKRENDKKCNIGCVAGVSYPQNAGSWFRKLNGRKSGMTPKLGAVAVWKNKKSGHVATVEEIRPDGSILCAESCYGSTIFRTKEYSNKYAKTGYTFLGFIYLKTEFLPPAVKKSDEEIAKEVIQGKWGNGAERVQRLTEAGYDYDTVQAIVNRILDERKDLKVGDKVKIIDQGASTKNGGKPAYGIGWTRFILNIYKDAEFPYQVGITGKGTVGFYKADALEK